MSKPNYKRPIIRFLAPINPLESSTRVRILKIIEYLKKSSEIADLVQYGDDLKSDLSYNTLVIQKLTDQATINLVETIKQRGIITVYDIVDRYNDVDILNAVDVIIADCKAIEGHCRQLVPNKKLDITIIPDSIDYIDKPIIRTPITKTDNLNIVFFASPSNVNCIENCKEALIKLSKEKSFKLTYIAGNPKPEYFKDLNVKFIPWSPYTFSMELRNFDLVILPQKVEKGDTKLVQAISHNVPAVSSNIESYRRIAEQTGTTEFLCNTQEEWYNSLIVMFNPETRNEFLNKTVNWIWRNYNINRIISEYRRLFTRLLLKKSDGK
jgi:glycosyltransferase involved in cell wall biosynthesis